MVLLFIMGAIVLFLLLLLIAFHFAIFVQVLSYALFVVVGFAFLGILYAIVRMLTAISRRISAASIDRSKARTERERARIEKERVQQAHNQVQMQQSKLRREEYAFYDRYQRRVFASPLAQEGRTLQGNAAQQQPKRRTTRNLALEEQEKQREKSPPVPPTIPHIVQLLDNLVRVGQTDLLHGFLIKDGAVEAIRGELPGTAIIAGKGRSGKTRRIILMVFQALLVFHALGKGFKITVCDLHAEKPDGLLKVLAPFIPWLSVARTYSEIVAAAREHIEESESRLTPQGSRNGEGLMPRLLIIDEFPKLMRSQILSKAEKRLIADAVRKSAVEYQGIGGYAWIIGQEWTEDAIFDTALRKDAQAIFCHQLSAEYAAFLFPLETRTQRLIQQIERRECVYKDADNHVLRIMTTTVTDEEIPSLVEYLARYVPRPASGQRNSSSSQEPLWQADHPVQQPLQAKASRRPHRSEVGTQQESSLHRTRVPSEATGLPDDTVLVPEPEEAIPQEASAHAVGETATTSVMEDRILQQMTFVTAEQLALLARIQKKKR
jgi:hypothetical protein